MTDPIADYLTRLRNASRAKQEKTCVPYSKMKEQISSVLLKKKYIQGYEVKPSGKFKEIIVSLNKWTKEPLNLKRISKPGQRIYLGTDDLKKIRSGMGSVVVSTSRGIMAGDEARKQKIGGEILCEIY
jgi:small subunit ribosomal protein S8